MTVVHVFHRLVRRVTIDTASYFCRRVKIFQNLKSTNTASFYIRVSIRHQTTQTLEGENLFEESIVSHRRCNLCATVRTVDCPLVGNHRLAYTASRQHSANCGQRKSIV